MITKEQIIELIKKQNREAANIISRMKDEGDLRYLEYIETLELLIKVNELMIEKAPFQEWTEHELQSLYNTHLAWDNQGSN